MPIANDRNQYIEQNSQCNSEDVIAGLGSTQGKSFSSGHDSDSVFHSNSEGTDQARTWIAVGGEASPGGIYRRLKELHQDWINLVESQQQVLESSLQKSKVLTEEMQNLQTLIAETLETEE